MRLGLISLRPASGCSHTPQRARTAGAAKLCRPYRTGEGAAQCSGCCPRLMARPTAKPVTPSVRSPYRCSSSRPTGPCLCLALSRPCRRDHQFEELGSCRWGLGIEEPRGRMGAWPVGQASSLATTTAENISRAGRLAFSGAGAPLVPVSRS